MSVFSLFHPLGSPDKADCMQGALQTEEAKQEDNMSSGHFWVTCSMASSSTPCRRDLLLGVVLHEAKTLIHHGIFSYSG